jgi:hypothetical protein
VICDLSSVILSSVIAETIKSSVVGTIAETIKSSVVGTTRRDLSSAISNEISR